MALAARDWKLRWRQYRALFQVYLQDGLAYPAQGMIWVLTDAITAIITPLLLIAAGDGAAMQGLVPPDLVAYYLGSMVIGSFVVCHFMWDIATEIREGIFSAHIVRPIGYFEFQICRNFAWRIIRTTLQIPILCFALLVFASYLPQIELHLSWQLFVMIFLGHLVSVSIVVGLAMIALVTEEAQAIFEIYYLPQSFLGGILFPIALLPDWAQLLAQWMPFYYTVGACADVLTGQIAPEATGPLIAAQVGWILGGWVLYKILFAFGMKRYSGVGM